MTQEQKTETLVTALKKIAENPCLDPEGNSEIAQTALSAVGIKWISIEEMFPPRS